MFKNVIAGAAFLALSALTPNGAHAAIYSTGLGPDGSVDPHWTVLQVGGSFFDDKGLTKPPHAYVASNSNSFPFGYWAQSLGNSSWIVPTVGGPTVSLDPNRDGFFLYSQLFSVAAGTQISGQFLADNDVTNISLVDLTHPKFSELIYNGKGEGSDDSATAFSLGTLRGDTYILSFLVDNFAQNGGNPSGLDVSVSAVPEASTWAMMIFGFLGVGFMAYRKKSPAAFRLA